MMDSDTPPPAKDDRALAMSRSDVVVRSSRALGAQDGRPVVVVLGMHRSGTSLLSNVLQFLGIDMADMTDNVSSNNAGGFWERPELVAIHDEILAAIDRPIGRASHALPFPPAWWRRKEVQALKPRLIAYVAGELAKSANPWGFKDPRTCRLLPLWWEIFRELNLRPIYVHATRSPGEASVSMAQQVVKKSPRKITAADGELMWLAYNYDVLRYVTAEHPTVMVNYDEWFSDGPAVAHRLIDELGIGDDLTPEDIVECVGSIVHREYRHQTDGENGVASTIPMAAMLYKAMTASAPLSSADALGLRRQLRLVDLFLKSLGSITAELDSATVAQAALLNEQRKLIERQAAVHQGHANQLTAAQQRLQEQEARVAALESEQHATFEKMLSAHTALEEAEKLGEQSKAAAEHDAIARRELTDQLIVTSKELAALAEQLDLATVRTTQLEVQLHGAQEELRLSGEANLRQLSDAQMRLNNSATKAQQGMAEIEALRTELTDRDRYSQQLLSEVQSIRAELAASQQHLSVLDDQNMRFAEQLEARDEALTALRQRDDFDEDVEASAVGFGWPVDAGDYGVEGRVSSVDENGIGGEISFTKRSDIIPIVEVRVGKALTLAQACTADPLGGGVAAAGAWRFAIPWSRLGREHAGRQAVVRIAGFDLELGRANIPTDLRRYHLTPALLAAEVFGQTVAEAGEYHRWIAEHETATDIELARAYRRDARAVWPRIAVVVYGGENNPDGLSATLQSLRSQVFGQWEALCVGALDDVAAIDPRARSVAASELAGELARYADDAMVSFVEANDRLAPTALLHLVTAALATPDFALIYSDEDRIDARSGVRALPYMKGDWSVDLALAQDYVSRLALLRRKQVALPEVLDAGQVHAMMLRSALAGGGEIIHLPFVLYHRAADNIDHKIDHLAAVAEVLAEQSDGVAGATVARLTDGRYRIEWPLPDPLPLVSLIVPTRDRIDLLRVCIDGFLHDTRYDNLEIAIADNGSVEADSLAYLAKVSNDPRVRLVQCPGPFNYSAINNRAAAQTTGTLIGLMNNDLKVIDPDWLRRMVSLAVRPDVGIVGAKLLYDDDTIQHAGVTLGIATASHLYKSFPPGAAGHNGRLLLSQDLSAVTAACLLIRRDVWDKIGGLDEEFPVAYNDIDLCLKVRKAGYRVVWTPDVLLYHLESQSRGTDLTPEKRERLDQDKARLMERWGDRLLSDPFHSPNLSDRHGDARLAFPARVRPPWRQEALSSSNRKRIA